MGQTVRVNGFPDSGLAVLQRMMLGALQRQPVDRMMVEPVVATTPPMPLVHSQTSVAMLVAIAATDPEARRRRATEGVEKGLGGLERLLEADRLGRAPTARIEELAAWMAEHEVPEDEAARRLLQDVELRVLVELAKRRAPPAG